jgi:long-chain acyl-CoA synthetase
VWDGGRLTYRELEGSAGALARDLAARGVRAGDRVAISVANRWPLAAVTLATLKLGATIAPLDPLLKRDERAEIVADLRPAVVVEDVAEPGSHGWPGLSRPLAPAMVLYTSGSTGRPKGALLSHAAVTFANESWAQAVMALTPDDVVLAVLPLTHAFGFNGALLAPLLAGATVVLLERFTPEGVADVLRERGVTVFPAVATMFRRMLDLADFSGGPRLRLGVSGAAPCSFELAEEWRARTGTRIIRGYGMTELFRPISYLASEATDLPGAIGRAVPGVELRIVDDAGGTLAAGATGELWIRTPGAMDGYLGADDETRAVLSGGWFKTGDLACISEAGFVTIVGRKRERILRGGYSVFPPEVETLLLTHPAIAEAAVIGVPHPDLGEEVAAFVALRPGTSVTADDIVAFSRDRLAGFKYPRQVTILPALPRSATGKVLKARLVR